MTFLKLSAIIRMWDTSAVPINNRAHIPFFRVLR